MSDIESRYHTNLLEYGFKELSTTNELSGIGRLYSVPKEYGEGTYWIYSEKDLYDIKIHDFCFHKDSFFDFGIPQGCLGICYYESISGEEISPYRRLTAGCVKSFIGGMEPCKTLIHKNIPVRSVDIEITPAYYDRYLKEKFPNEYIDPHEAFSNIALTDRFPEMIQVLRQIANYKGNGIALEAAAVSDGSLHTSADYFSLLLFHSLWNTIGSNPAHPLSKSLTQTFVLWKMELHISTIISTVIFLSINFPILLVWDEQNSNSHLRKFMAFLSRNIFSRDG